MNNESLGVSDCLLTHCTVLTSSNKTLNFRNLVIELNYYEDIFANCITGNILVNDSLGYINLLQFDGSESIFIQMDNPGRDKPISRFFRLFSVTNRTSTNNTNENYVLHFCSDELFLSEQFRISKAYNKKTISSIIESICKDYLRMDDRISYIEETVGLRDIIIPAYKPLQAINWLCSLSLSKAIEGGIGTTYVFYENKDGYNFESLHGLYQQKIYRELFYEVKNINNIDKPFLPEIGKDYNSVISYKHVSNFDTLSNSMAGTFYNKLITFDPIRGLFGEKEFNYKDFIDNTPTINKHPFHASDKTKLDTSMETSSSVVRFAVSTTGQSENKYIKDKKITVHENNIENVLPYRLSQLMLLTNDKLQVMIPGDITMTAGVIVKFNLPNISKGMFGEELDEFYSGKFLVTAVRHLYQASQGFYTVLELCKDSTTTPRTKPMSSTEE